MYIDEYNTKSNALILTENQLFRYDMTIEDICVDVSLNQIILLTFVPIFSQVFPHTHLLP